MFKFIHYFACRSIALGLLLLVFCSTAGANYYSEIVTSTIPLTATDYNQSLALKTFNTSLGTLENIVISYSDNGTMQGFVQNTSNSTQKFTVSEDSKITLTYGATALLTNNLIASQSYSSLAALQIAQFGIDNPSGEAASPQITSGPLFNAFLEPSSSVMMAFGTLTSTIVVGGGGNVSTGIYTSVGATVTVTFEYTPFVIVPEPASLALTTIGILSLGATSLRVRRKQVGKISAR